MFIFVADSTVVIFLRVKWVRWHCMNIVNCLSIKILVYIYIYIYIYIYRLSQEECEILRESVPYVKLYRYNPKHLYSKLNDYGDNGK